MGRVNENTICYSKAKSLKAPNDVAKAVWEGGGLLDYKVDSNNNVAIFMGDAAKGYTPCTIRKLVEEDAKIFLRTMRKLMEES